MSIQDLLSSPESKTLEFKETMPTPQAIAKTACAFANSGGGAVIIGVGDRDKKIIGIDEIEIMEATVDELDRKNIETYLNKREKARDIPQAEPDTDFLQKIKAIKQHNGTGHPTVAGILLFSNQPEHHIPGAVVKCARFMGNDMDEFIDQRIITGSIFTQAEETIAFFKKNIKRSAKIEGLYRTEKYEYPEKAIREALVNALCHRDYSRRGADIKFAIFDNRLEITSPGGLPPNVTIEDLGTGVSELRNKIIGKILNEAGLIEGYGTGILRIRKYFEEKGLVQPEFRDNNGFFKAIFYSPKIEEAKISEREVEREDREVEREVETTLGEIEKEVEKLTENQKMILELIKKDPHISKNEMSNVIGIRTSSIDKNIKTLKDKMYLERIGPAKGGYWKLIKKIDTP